MSNWFCGAPPARPPHPSTVKASVTAQHASVVSITGILGNDAAGGPLRGIGVLIHPTLILSTHSTIPSAGCIKDAEITFCRDVPSLTYVKRKFVPEIFFQTDVDLDLTIVSCEIVAPEMDYLALDTTRLRRRALRKGHTIFIMGCQVREPEDVAILEGQIAGLVGSESLSTYLRFQTGEDIWMPGSAGFDEFGSFCFIVTKPPRLHVEDPYALASDATSGAMGGLFSQKPKQWGTCIQSIKDWVAPLWKMSRNEVFQGPPPPSTKQLSPRRPLSQGDALYKQKSFTPRSSTVTSSLIRQATQLSHNDEQASTAKAPSSKVIKAETPQTAAVQPKKKPAEDKTATKSIAVETVSDDAESDHERLAIRTPKKKAQLKARKPDANVKQRIDIKKNTFAALKQNKGLKRLADKATKTNQETDSVSVQTELFVTEADVKPVIIVSRSPEAPSEVRAEGMGPVGRKGRRERWSLPADGHGLDLMREKVDDDRPAGSSPPPPRGGRQTPGPFGRSVSMKEISHDGGAPAWIDKYYARGRSRSARGSRTSSAATTPPRQRRPILDDVDVDEDMDPDSPAASLSGGSASSARSIQRSYSTSSVYSKPTISYMQKRNLAQRDSILARRASQTNVPRWC